MRLIILLSLILTLRANTTEKVVDKYYLEGQKNFNAKKYIEAIIAFEKVPVGDEYKEEAQYYIALSFLKNNDQDEAIDAFKEVLKGNDAKLKASSHFYLGLLNYKQEKMEDSRNNFVKVIELTESEALMFESFKYMDYIDRKIEQMRKLHRRFVFMFELDPFTYDSNVPSLPSSNSAIKGKSGVGTGWNLTTGYIPLNNKKHELDVKYNLGFSRFYEDKFAIYNITTHTFMAPYMYNTMLNEHPFKYLLTPQLSIAYANDSNDKNIVANKTIANTYMLSNSFTYMHNKDFMSVININIRNEDIKRNKSIDHLVDINSSEEDASGTGTMINWVLIKYQDVEHKSSYSIGPGIDYFTATGADFSFYKVLLEVSAIKPLPFWGLSMMPKANIVRTNYFDTKNNRTDYVFSGELMLGRLITENIRISENAKYLRNTSSVKGNDYSKFTFLVTLSYVY